MKAEIITQFVNAINQKDFNAIEQFLAADHQYVDAEGITHVNNESTLSAWKNYFQLYPDYTIDIEKQVHHGDTIAVLGFTRGTLNSSYPNKNELTWKIPAAWKVLVEHDKIKHWQIYVDTKVTSDILSKYGTHSNLDSNSVSGFGGVFFKSKDPKALCAWYDMHLGTNFGTNSYHTFKWRERENSNQIGRTEFSVFSEKSEYFFPSEKPYMLNFRVKNLDIILTKLKAEGVLVQDKIERLEYGNFGWIMDLEGNKIELWEPIDQVLEDFDKLK